MVKKSAKTAQTARTVDLWAAQCGKCSKWRKIATEEEFEDIRSKIEEKPFFCSRKSKVSCEDPADIEYDSSRIWVMDKPNIPKTPTGFKRRLVMRSDYSKMDVYYITPTGRSLRSSTEVASFLKENPQYKIVSLSNFSFKSPKVMVDTIPCDVGKKAVVGGRGPNS